MKQIELLQRFIDPRTDLTDKIIMMTDDPALVGERLPKSAFIARAELSLASAYVMILEHEKTQHYERCDLLKRFVAELKRVYRYAVQTYSDFTMSDFHKLDRADVSIMKHYFPEAAATA